MEKIKFGFVVLHYQAFDMTVECIETLKTNFNLSNMFIVIVDNKSPNGSGLVLAQKYEREDRIKVILSSDNSGFAKGNNLGYEFISNNFETEFMIVMNNDVLITQPDFFDVVENIYASEKFAVLGPDVYCPKVGIHQNPFRLDGIKKNEFRKMFFIERVKKLLGYSLYNKLIQPVLDMRHKDKIKEDEIFKITHLNPVLHGSCFIFSKEFMKNREYAFNPQTYMFFEENILYYECMKLGLKTLYSPRVQVNHMEDVSTDMIFKRNVQKENWKIKNTINSMKVYKSILEGSDE